MQPLILDLSRKPPYLVWGIFSATEKFIRKAKYADRDATALEIIDLFNGYFKTGLLNSEVVEDSSDQRELFIALAILQALSTHDVSSPVYQDELNETVKEPDEAAIAPGDQAYPQSLLLPHDYQPMRDFLDCHVDHEKGKLSIGSGPPIVIGDKEPWKG